MKNNGRVFQGYALFSRIIQEGGDHLHGSIVYTTFWHEKPYFYFILVLVAEFFYCYCTGDYFLDKVRIALHSFTYNKI